MAPKPRPWFRFYTETVKDRKVRRLDLASRWLMVTCFSIARESPKPGWLLFSEGDPYLAEDLQDAAAITLRQVKAGLSKLEEAHVLESISGVWHVTNWDKRQYEGDTSTERSRRSRARSADGSNDDATLHDRSMQRPPSVQRTETENREQRTEPDYILNNNKPVATPGVPAAAEEAEAAKLVGIALSSGATKPGAYAATVARKILAADDPTDLERIRQELAEGRTPQQVADGWRMEDPKLPAPKPRRFCGSCVNGMTFDDETGLAHRCGCNELFPKLEVVQ